MAISPVPLELSHRAVGDAIVVAVRGRLDRAQYPRVKGYLLKCAAEAPTALVVELCAVQCADPIALSVFVTVAHQLAHWPGVVLRLVCGADSGAVAADSHLRRFLDVHATTDEALAAVSAPMRRVAGVELPNDHSALRIGRVFIRETLAGWGLDEFLHEGVLLASELVQNTIQHTLSAPAVRLEHRRGVLSVAVYDEDPAHPEPRSVEQARSRALHGLGLVANLAAAWGTSATPSGGKVVWATLRTSTTAAD
ncbi:ATP-binding protein [Actinokineospora spheciospongiae]|uniref:ATP-binding protein n=1 Tax=Actinokineospora spheciospongiae TaxID=909613 RepID=UPI000D95585C|nr:ATP-binding protein [Actinokineospora spheciospongiae]PWW66939.1 anti-anti-sigma factor [Actinokineospora spheciospongiae]